MLKPITNEIERGLTDEDESVRAAFAERIKSINPIIPQNLNTFCRGRLLGDTDIVECLMEVVRCQYATHFRDGRICKHPSAKQFVVPIQP